MWRGAQTDTCPDTAKYATHLAPTWLGRCGLKSGKLCAAPAGKTQYATEQD